jgi:hypothetical protein
LEYVVEGYQHRAERVSLRLSIWNEARKGAAKRRYTKAVGGLFAGLRIRIPSGLLAALDAEVEFKSEQDYGKVSLAVVKNARPRDPARDDTAYRGSFDLEIRDSIADQSARARHRELFAACKTEVIKHYPAPSHDVGGEGLPTFYDASVIFDVDWRNRLLPGQGTKLYVSPVLCTVYRDGRFELFASGIFRPNEPQSSALAVRPEPPEDSASSDLSSRQATNRLKSRSILREMQQLAQKGRAMQDLRKHMSSSSDPLYSDLAPYRKCGELMRSYQARVALLKAQAQELSLSWLVDASEPLRLCVSCMAKASDFCAGFESTLKEESDGIR